MWKSTVETNSPGNLHKISVKYSCQVLWSCYRLTLTPLTSSVAIIAWQMNHRGRLAPPLVNGLHLNTAQSLTRFTKPLTVADIMNSFVCAKIHKCCFVLFFPGVCFISLWCGLTAIPLSDIHTSAPTDNQQGAFDYKWRGHTIKAVFTNQSTLTSSTTARTHFFFCCCSEHVWLVLSAWAGSWMGDVFEDRFRDVWNSTEKKESIICFLWTFYSVWQPLRELPLKVG